MNRLVIIDGNAILHRAFHALPPLTTGEGELINAVYGFTSMLFRIIEDLKPQYLAVTFDRPKPTFRKSLYAGYQAHRPKMDEGLSSQIGRVHEVLEVMKIPIFEVDGYEADDVIGTLVSETSGLKLKSPFGKAWGKQKSPYNLQSKFTGQAKVKNTTQNSKLYRDVETIIVTGDRDILQLVDSDTKVCMPVKGLAETKIYGEKEVVEKFGIHPTQMIDYKSLVGDQSDGYPGVLGVGPKTAAELLTRFKTLEGAYEHIGEIESEKLRKTLSENFEQAELAKRLATIVRDVPINFDLKKCRLPDFNNKQVLDLFKKLEFKSLVARVGFWGKGGEKDEEREKIMAEIFPKKIDKKEDKKDQLSMF